MHELSTNSLYPYIMGQIVISYFMYFNDTVEMFAVIVVTMRLHCYLSSGKHQATAVDQLINNLEMHSVLQWFSVGSVWQR